MKGNYQIPLDKKKEEDYQILYLNSCSHPPIITHIKK